MEKLKSKTLRKNVNRLILLSIALTVAMVALVSSATAAVTDLSYGTGIVVDGNINDWDLSKDYFADMYRAGETDKVVESKLYLRYNCAEKVMYVLVLEEPPAQALPLVGDAWIKINGDKVTTEGESDSFKWVYRDPETKTDLDGYEASFAINEGSYKLDAHIQVQDDDESQTSRTDKNLLDLVIKCPTLVENLDVSKTATTSYTRTHNWDITKSVTTENGYMHEGFPKLWLYINGDGDEAATWIVDVEYKGYEDSNFDVSGVITIKNTGTLPATINSINDVLGGTPIEVVLPAEVTLPYTLPVGETLECSYSEAVDSKIEGSNDVTVTTESNNEYKASAQVIWNDEPNTENYETITVQDISDLFGEMDLGTVTAPQDKQFTYSKDFAWEDYGKDACGDYTYRNTATIVETGQSADATLKVNVQCYMYETAYAKGNDPTCFSPTFSNWGWTNKISSGTYTMDLWAGAAQCDTTKGTNVGTVTVNYENGYVTVTYNVVAPYLLEETHVYAGSEMFPKDKKGNPTIAPGQYSIASSLEGDAYVIAHAVVGIPDPNFGPE